MRILKLSSETIKILLLFLSWRLALIVVLFFSIKFVPLAHTDRFLGGGPFNYQIAPELFAWANFDGEHYLSIAIFGYNNLQQAFFPVYPFAISFLSKPFSYDLFSSLLWSAFFGFLISNTAFILSLIFLWKLIKMDYSQKLSYLTIFILLIFPTSFYFGAVYSESLFLLFSVLSFFCARRGKWFLASVFGMISSATRVFGILLLPALLIEAYQQRVSFSKIFWVLLIPVGLGAYMLYLYLTIGDPIAFYSLQKNVGEQHQSGVILLPQVYFRYIKMILTVDMHNPIYQTIVLEFLVGAVFLLLPIYGYFKKIRLSYLFFALICFLLPTIQGSFSSVPRYIIVLFPSFLALAIFLNSLPKLARIIYFVVSSFLLALETGLFLRGYWVA